MFFDVSESTRNKPKTLRTRPAKPPSGKLPLTLVLSLVPRMLAGGDRFVVYDGDDPVQQDGLPRLLRMGGRHEHTRGERC